MEIGKFIKENILTNKMLVRGLIGGVIISSIKYALDLESEPEEEKETSVVKNESDKKDSEKKFNIDYSEVVKKVIHEIKYDSSHGFYEDIKEDIDDEKYPTYIHIRSGRGGVLVTFKFNDTLYRSNRGSKCPDPTRTCIDDIIKNVIKSNDKYSGIESSSIAKGIYFSLKEGDNEESIDYNSLRSLRYVRGFRYLEYKFKGDNGDSLSEFIKEVLNYFHPDGIGEDEDLFITPLVTGEVDNKPKSNTLVREYLEP